MFMEKKSNIQGFHSLDPKKRLELVAQFAGLTPEERKLLETTGRLDLEHASRMIENVVGTNELPLGIATNFLINGKDYLIPMCIEEPSVVAAASYAAKLARPAGGFRADSDEPIMIGQIQIINVKNMDKAEKRILSEKESIIQKANERDSVLIKFGGGAKDVIVRRINSNIIGPMIVVHLLVDVRDAMGANAVNTMCEAISPYLEELTGGDVKLKIITNLATERLARARAVWKKEALEESTKGLMKGGEVVDSVIAAYSLAEADKYRCSTHNKGIMNGIDAVVIATGNDFRAVEAGAHSYAAISGEYKPLTRYYKDKNGDLVGEIELPIAVGTIGGATRTNPIAGVSLKILGVKTAKELAQVIASVGLAQNFAALRAMSTEGIQTGHMKLHAANIAITAGAKGKQIDAVAKRMIEEKNISANCAKEILESLRK
jgi:hydroxymethylglutaryl-CoA reductase